MILRRWWQPPGLRTDEDEGLERKATWLELFYDLVFVVVIAELAHELSAHINLNGILTFIFLFIPVWWTWNDTTFYAERFEADDISYRLFMFAHMAAVASMAVFVHDALGETSQGFAITYSIARILFIIMLVRGGIGEERIRAAAKRLSTGYSVTNLALKRT